MNKVLAFVSDSSKMQIFGKKSFLKAGSLSFTGLSVDGVRKSVLLLFD